VHDARVTDQPLSDTHAFISEQHLHENARSIVLANNCGTNLTRLHRLLGSTSEGFGAATLQTPHASMRMLTSLGVFKQMLTTCQLPATAAVATVTSGAHTLSQNRNTPRAFHCLTGTQNCPLLGSSVQETRYSHQRTHACARPHPKIRRQDKEPLHIIYRMQHAVPAHNTEQPAANKPPVSLLSAVAAY
jgi:hypothetical protein